MKKTETENKKKNKIFKAGVLSSLLVAALLSGFFISSIPEAYNDNLKDVFEPEPVEEEWQTIAVWEPNLRPLGEADAGADGNGFLSIFLLNYSEDPFTVLQNNATDWENDATVHAYADTDSFNEDTPSETGFYFVVRARFTKSVCYNEGKSMFEANRTKCTITFSGDESGTITHYGNLTDGATGGGVPSENQSAGDALFVNYYFDDNDDGYRVQDDGSITVSLIELSAKY